MHKLAAISLGCEKNLIDTEIMLGLLERNGFDLIYDPQDAEVILINTCGFIESAKQESINTILEMAQYKESDSCRLLVVCGCLAQKYREELLAGMPEIDLLFGTNDIDRIEKLIDDALADLKTGKVRSRACQPSIQEFLCSSDMPRIVTTPPYQAYIKIAEGCSNHCSYCVIPDIRGSYRSRPIEDIVLEAERFVAQGCKELLLIAQDTTFYGMDIYHRPCLAELLDRLAAIEGDFWLRVLYCYPNNFDRQLIECYKKNPKLCRYVDIPLQHINDEILFDMKRHVNAEQIKNLLLTLRQEIPHLVIRTTFIVGYPGETDEQFAELLDFVAETRFDRLGVFQYSQEPDTLAGERKDQIEPEVKQQRYDRLMQLQQTISLQNNKRMIGCSLKVLVEGTAHINGKLLYFGRSRRELPEIDGVIYFSSPAKKRWQAGDIATVKITEAMEYDLKGVAIG